MPIHEFHHLTRDKFWAYIWNIYAVIRATIHEFHHLTRINGRISSVRESYVRSSYSAKIGCMSKANNRISSTARVKFKHIISTENFRSSPNTPKSSVGATQFWIPNSVQICCVLRACTQNYSDCARHVSIPYSSPRDIRFSTNSRTNWVGVNYFWSLYSAQVGARWAPKYKFFHLSRVTFRAYIPNRYALDREPINEILELMQVLFGANIEHR